MKRHVVARMCIVFILISVGKSVYPYSHDSLSNDVDAMLQQIDASYQGATDAAKQTQKKAAPSAIGASARRTAEHLPVVKAAELEQAKHQIDLAEEEIAKLKESIRSMEAQGLTPKKENVQRIIRLNKGLIQTYDKTLQN